MPIPTYLEEAVAPLNEHLRQLQVVLTKTIERTVEATKTREMHRLGSSSLERVARDILDAGNALDPAMLDALKKDALESDNAADYERRKELVDRAVMMDRMHRAGVRGPAASLGIAICSYCGWQSNVGYKKDCDEAEEAHDKVCEKHPMRALEREIAELHAKLNAPLMRQISHCVWCGWEQEFPTKNDSFQGSKVHMGLCEKHPLHELRRVNENARQVLLSKIAPVPDTLALNLEHVAFVAAKFLDDRAAMAAQLDAKEKVLQRVAGECAELRTKVNTYSDQLDDMHAQRDLLKIELAELKAAQP